MASPSMRREWIEIESSSAERVRKLSPSMRREWIEIRLLRIQRLACGESPSMRREWIEIGSRLCTALVPVVSLHAEGVD